MKQVAFLSAGAFLLMTLWTASVLAADLIAAQMICDTNGDGTYAGPGETAGGTVRITTAGDLRFKLSGLEPGKTYGCNLSCTFDLSHWVFSKDCVADSHGRLNAVFAGVATPEALSTGCVLPIPFVATSPGFCDMGYGTNAPAVIP
jgi:hypothetical protein